MVVESTFARLRVTRVNDHWVPDYQWYFMFLWEEMLLKFRR